MNRAVLFTGKGGAGVTTVAAATAVRCAALGRRTLLLSLGPAHALSDVLDASVAVEAAPVDAKGAAHLPLWAQEVDAFAEAERTWGPIEAWLRRTLARAYGAELPMEIAALPGAEAVAGLLALLGHAESGSFDVIVVDCPPVAETLRLLAAADSLAGAAGGHDGAAGGHRAARPLLLRLFNLPEPDGSVVGFARGFVGRLERIRLLLTDPTRASVRSVINPGRGAVAACRTALSGVSLHELAVDAVICNRAGPLSSPLDLDGLRATCGDLPLLMSPEIPAEPVGITALDRLGASFYGEGDPELAHAARPERMHVEQERGRLALCLPLRSAALDALSVSQTGDRISVRVGTARRTIVLPEALAGRACTGARLDGDSLRLRFE